MTQEERLKARRLSSAKYKKANIANVVVSFNKRKEADMIEWVNRHAPKNRYIRALIRADMKKRR